jgi:hypothetical protein
MLYFALGPSFGATVALRIYLWKRRHVSDPVEAAA